MAKTTVRPPAGKSTSKGLKPFFGPAATSFPNRMRKITQTYADWRQKEKHSEKLKPYLMDPDQSWPSMEDTYPTPLSVEKPYIGGIENWTHIEHFGGGEAYRFNCIVHCSHKATPKKEYCEVPVTCDYGAWTKLKDGGVNRWQGWVKMGQEDQEQVYFGKVEYDGASAVKLYGPNGSWFDLCSKYDTNKLKLRMIYYDKGQPTGKYYYPPGAIVKPGERKLRRGKWITILEGKPFCDDMVTVMCDPCPPETLMTFDDASTPDEVAVGGSISVYVKDGQSPYTWTVSGTGMSLAESETEGVSNTLSCAPGDCGDGEDWSAYATITVTDFCETSVSFKILADGGQWNLRTGDDEAIYGWTCPSQCTLCSENSGFGCKQCEDSASPRHVGTGANAHYSWVPFSYACQYATGSCADYGSMEWTTILADCSEGAKPDPYPPYEPEAIASWKPACSAHECDHTTPPACTETACIVDGAYQYEWGCVP